MFVKIKREYDGKQNIVLININQIVLLEYDKGGYCIELSNGFCCCVTNEEFNPIMDYMQKHNLLFITGLK